MAEPTLGQRLFTTLWPVALAIVGVVASFTGHFVVAWAINIFIIARLFWLMPGWWRSKKRLDQSMLELVDSVLDRELHWHQPTGSYEEYCRSCGPGTRWPCAQYLHASTVRGEPPKARRKWFMSGAYGGP